MQDNGQTHAGDLAALEDLADRFGIPAGDGKTHELFRSPDAVRRALC